MKKNLLTGFLMLFLLSTTTFAVFADSKKGSETSPVTNSRENKLSDEELSRMNRRAETDNISKASLTDKATNDSRNNLKAPNQLIVENHHHGYYYGGVGLLLVIILVVVLI